MRMLLLFIPVVMPGPLKRVWYRRIFGWKIGRRVRIGLSYLDASDVDIGDDVRIGHFNLVRAVTRFVVGRQTTIKNFNQFSGGREIGSGWTRTLVFGERIYVTSRHFFDVAGELRIGDETIIAGRDSQFWTHTIQPNCNGLELTPRILQVGQRCYIGARVTLLYCSIPDEFLVGAGSVVTKSFHHLSGRVLIAGNPAKVCKTYPPQIAVKIRESLE